MPNLAISLFRHVYLNSVEVEFQMLRLKLDKKHMDLGAYRAYFLDHTFLMARLGRVNNHITEKSIYLKKDQQSSLNIKLEI